MAYRIKLTRYSPDQEKFKGRNSFRMMIVASNNEDMPAEIFAHQKTLKDGSTSETQDEFIFICSPFDLSAYPANEPNPTQSPAFFRKSSIDVMLPGLEIADEFFELIKTEVCHLIDLMEINDRLETVEEHWCPGPPDEEDSSESSEESSESSSEAP